MSNDETSQHTFSLPKFVVTLVFCLAFCQVFWSKAIEDKLYNCTDAAFLDFLFPGHWVHHPVAVLHVSAGRSMNEPDTIKQGWGIARLWCLWAVFAGVSILASWALAIIPWTRSP